jgi:hypothetical protein
MESRQTAREFAALDAAAEEPLLEEEWLVLAASEHAAEPSAVGSGAEASWASAV